MLEIDLIYKIILKVGRLNLYTIRLYRECEIIDKSIRIN